MRLDPVAGGLADADAALPCGCPSDGHRTGTRAAKIFTIFEGTSEIQCMIIGRAVTGLDVR
jgi:hypothetical protein